MTSLVAAALQYASRGWLVLPLHTPTGTDCSCGKPDCEHPGKHPRTEHGFHDATTDEATIRRWWFQWPDANIGVATGTVSGIAVLDIDPRHGGDESLADLERQHGTLPDTVESITGGGGRHILFAYPGGYVKSRSIAPGIDIKGDGGYIVAPQSRHATGGQYEWELLSHPDDTPLAPLPDWLLTMIASPSAEPVPLTAEEAAVIPEGNRNGTLTSLAGTMRRRGMSEDGICAALLAENARRCVPPLPQEEVRRIVRSVARYEPGVTPSVIDLFGTDAKRLDTNVAADTGIPVPAEADGTPMANPWPEPLTPAAFHGLAGDFVRAIEPHTEADPVALLISYFVAVGSVVGRGPHFVAEAARHYTNLNAVLVGQTARGRKGSSWAQVRRPFETIDADWALDRIKYGLSSGEGLIWAVRDAIEKQEPVREKGRVVGYQTVVEDPGVDDKRVLIVEQEFASTLRVMGRDGNTLSPTIRQAWDTGDLRIMTKNSPAKATGAHISIIAHITRDEVLRYLDSTEAGNGFANRFLWVCVRRSKLLPEGGHIQELDFGPFVRALKSAVEYARGVTEMKRDAEARELWRQVYPTLSADVPGLVGAMIARSEAQTLRLACLYALLDQSATVRREHLEAALALWGYCEDSARFVFGDALGDPVADEILRTLRQTEDGLTRTEISKHFGRNRAAADISRALARLLEAGLAVGMPDAPTGGRPAERWFAVTPGRRADSQSTKETNETK